MVMWLWQRSPFREGGTVTVSYDRYRLAINDTGSEALQRLTIGEKEQ